MKEKFIELARIIVDNLEGGYYHPDMFKDGRLRPDPRTMALYRNSGETMYGIDRKAGAGIRNIAPVAWDNFWQTIDRAGAARTWRYLYKGGNLSGELSRLMGEVMWPVYQKYADQYLTDKARAVVESLPGLFLHFAYGAWNGPGWFKKYAANANAGAKAGRSAAQLLEDGIGVRLNSGNTIIIRTGQKIRALVTSKKVPAAFKSALPIILAAAALFF